MPDPRDTIDISWLPQPDAAPEPRRRHADDASQPPSRPWLGIMFNCCHVYARIYKSPDGSRYVGRCPRCAAEVQAKVGIAGTNRRFFEAS